MTTAPAETRAESDLALNAVAAHRAAANAAEVAALEWALSYCDLNPGTGRDATLDLVYDIPLAGEGAPLVAEEAVVEFGPALGLSPHAARSYLADSLELGHRLPRLWARVRAGEVLVFRARMIAAKTHVLSAAAAAYVDARIAPIADKVGPTRLMQLVEEAQALHDPEEALARAEAAAEQRHATVYRNQPVDGQVDLVARLDYADAVDLDTALAAIAHELSEAGDPTPLDVRRSKALGELARRHNGTSSRQVQLYVHLDRDLAGTGLARLERGPLVTVDQVRDWCTTAGTRVRVTPVLDLAEDLRRDGYVPTSRMHEQAVLRAHATCAFPGCTRAARTADLDHIEAYDAGGETRSANLAPLCRPHHRHKTFSGWTYTQPEPGVYLWTSPSGRRYLRDRDGTRRLRAGTAPPRAAGGP